MAGIGQRYTSDNVPWNSFQSSFGMGRTFPESNKQFSPFMPPEKRPFPSSGVGNSPAMPDIPMLNGEINQSRSHNYMIESSNSENGPSLLSSFVNKRSPMGSDTPSLFYNSSPQMKSMSRFPTNGTLLDPSDFPPIQQSGSKQSTQTNVSQQNPSNLAQSSQASTQLRSYLSAQSNSAPHYKSGVDSSASSNSSVFQSPPEFSIDNDFPALPGSQAGSQQSTSRSQHHTPQPSILVSNGMLAGAQTPTCQGLNTTVPKNMISDQYGMLGLFRLIHDRDSTPYFLAPGIDLFSLNINCQTPGFGELYHTFLSPCHDSCMGRPQDLDFPVPEEYLIRHAISENLIDPPMGKLNENTLFWLFYNCCQEEVQLVAAKELSNQKWLYHKKENVWFLPNLHHNSPLITYWDPTTSKRAQKEMVVNYSTDVDDFPNNCRMTSGLLSASITKISSNPISSGGSLSIPSASGSSAYMFPQSNLLNATVSGMKQQQLKSQPNVGQGLFISGGPSNSGTSQVSTAVAVSIANRNPGHIPNGLMHVSASSPSLLTQKQLHLGHHLMGPNSTSNGGTNGQPTGLHNGLLDSMSSMRLQEKLLKSDPKSVAGPGAATSSALE